MKQLAKEKRWANQNPELGTEPVPIESCISKKYFELERERIFRRVWLNVGREEEIPNVGDFFVKDIEVCSTSILVVRGKDNVIRGFHNMCSHRGSRLVWDEHGFQRAFTCHFHGWTYDMEGRLTGVPDEGMFFDFRKSEHGLTPVATASWRGFVFVNLDPNPKETLQQYLGELGERLSPYPFEKMTSCHVWRVELGINWKVALSPFQELYHVPLLHKGTFAAPTTTSKENPFCYPVWLQLYSIHHSCSVFGNPKYQPTAVEALAKRFGGVSGSAFAADSSANYIDQLPPGVNPGRSPYWSFDINVIFPNFFVDVVDVMYFTYSFWPLAVDRTVFEMKLYYPEPENAGQLFSQECSNCTIRDLMLQDLGNVERIQSVLASGAKTHFILQDNEILVRHSHKVVDDFVGI